MPFVVEMSPAVTTPGPVARISTPLRALDLHLHRDALEVQHDVGDVLADARNATRTRAARRRSARGDRRALQRGEQHAPQRVAEGEAEAALQRLGDGGGLAQRIGARP